MGVVVHNCNLAVGRLSQEDPKLEANLVWTIKFYFKNKWLPLAAVAGSSMDLCTCTLLEPHPFLPELGGGWCGGHLLPQLPVHWGNFRCTVCWFILLVHSLWPWELHCPLSLVWVNQERRHVQTSSENDSMRDFENTRKVGIFQSAKWFKNVNNSLDWAP